MQLGVLVDRGVDVRDQAGGLEIGKVILEIEAGPLARRTRAASFIGLIEHDGAEFLLAIPSPYHTGSAADKAPNLLMNSEPGTTTAAGGTSCMYRHISRKIALPFCTTPSGHMVLAPW